MKHRVAVVMLFCAVAVLVSATATQAAPKASSFTVTVLDAETGAKVYPAFVALYTAKQNSSGDWVEDEFQWCYGTAKSGKVNIGGLAPKTHYVLNVFEATTYPGTSVVILTDKSGGGSVTVYI
jgi:hypothetical protein